MLNYRQTIKFSSDYVWYNPRNISNYKKEYYSIASLHSNLSLNPEEDFNDDVSYFAYSSLFGEEYFTFEEALEYCSIEYAKLKSSISNQLFINNLRINEERLPASPNIKYKEDWRSWEYFFSSQKPPVSG